MEAAADDARLIEASWTDPAVFGEVYDRHAAALFGYLVRRVGRDEAESLLGDLFRSAFEVRHTYRLDRLDARPWLYGIAANLIKKHYRSEERRRRALQRLAALRPVAASFEDDADAAMDAAAQWPRIADAIASLPTRDRDVVLLYAWEHLSYGDIAVALGIPVGTVRSRLNRARTQLRELVGVDGKEPDDPPVRARGGGTR